MRSHNQTCYSHRAARVCVKSLMDAGRRKMEEGNGREQDERRRDTTRIYSAAPRVVPREMWNTNYPRRIRPPVAPISSPRVCFEESERISGIINKWETAAARKCLLERCNVCITTLLNIEF